MKRLTLVGAAVLAAAVLLPAWPMHGARPAAAATATPAALQYDEITRTIIPPATPPAPGTFQADYTTAMSAVASSGGDASPTPAPKHGLGSLLGSVMGGGNADVSDAMNKLNAMRQGMLTRLTYYKGWLRTEYPTLQTATISKCAEHQFITLDLAKKTYTIANTAPACPTNAPMPSGPRNQSEVNEAPGTADMNFSATRNDLGPLTIDSIPTTGFDSTMSMSTTNATGSCSDGSFSMQMERYISKISIPRSYCPLPRARQMESPGGMVVHGGCKPTMHMTGSASGLAEPDTLVMYSKMNMGGAQGQSRGGAGFAMVVERGNVKWFSGPAADALFAVPPGFTQAGS